MNLLLSLLAVVILSLVAWGGHASVSLAPVFLVVIPYGAFVVFIAGFVWRIVSWAQSPVPFRIPTTCGQQKTLPWMKSDALESPSGTAGVIGRMALEVLLFRSLFRNTKAELYDGRPVYGSDKWLWFWGLTFHWSLLVILVRHLRLFVEPAPKLAVALDRLDGFFQVSAPVFYWTDAVVLVALLYLLQRRFRDPQVRYISLFTDYFALFLLLAIAISGIWMRYVARTDAVAVKQFAIGLTTLAPVVPKSVGAWFYAHLALVSTLAGYLPFSKLVHMGGVFLSPTRNLANNNRSKRHVNPWNYPVKVHTYEEWEDEFRDKMEAAGLPVEKR